MKFSLTDLTLDELHTIMNALTGTSAPVPYSEITEQIHASMNSGKRNRTRKPKRFETSEDEPMTSEDEPMTSEDEPMTSEAPQLTRDELFKAVVAKVMRGDMSLPDMLAILRTENIMSLNEIPDEPGIIRALTGKLL